MSLLDLANGVISSLNPSVSVTLYQYSGCTQAPGGPRTPTYNVITNVSAQVQELTANEIKHMDDLNMGGLLHNIWCDTVLHALDRTSQLGGDCIGMADGTYWLVVRIKEQFTDGWCSATIQKVTALP